MAAKKSKAKNDKTQGDQTSLKKSFNLVPRSSKKDSKKKVKSTNPAIGYLKGAWAEIRRVTWPNRKEAVRLTIGVVIFSVTTALIISLIDYGFGEAFQEILLGS